MNRTPATRRLLLAPLTLAALTVAALAVAAPGHAQGPAAADLAVRGSDRPADLAAARAAATARLERRIEDERQRHQRDRLLGSGLLTAGAVAVVGSFVAWTDRDTLGMRPGAAAILLGGTGLVALGAERRRAATRSLRQAERWEAELRGAPGSSGTGGTDRESRR